MSDWQFWTIVGTLVVIALLLVDRRKATVGGLDDALDHLNQEAKHYVQVNAVLALVEQFEERPELIANLQDYSRQVVAAALLTRVNAIGNDIKVAQRELSEREKQYANQLIDISTVNTQKQRVDELYKQLHAADQVAQQYRALRSV